MSTTPKISRSQATQREPSTDAAVGIPPMRDLPVFVYVIAFVAYVAAGFFLQTTVLNYVVGPFVLLIALHLVPMTAVRCWRALTGRRRTRT